MSINQNKSVAVIGAGIVGVNCAAQLQLAGYNVTLFDEKGIGEGCSKGNAGHFATEQVFPLADKKLLIELPKLLIDPLSPMAIAPNYFFKALPWFMRFMGNMLATKQKNNQRALTSLNQNAIRYYQEILQRANAEYLLTNKGSLLVFESLDKKEVEKQYHHYRDAGVNVKLLNKSELAQLEPNLHDNINYALYFTDVAHTVNPHEICRVIGNLAIVHGCQFVKEKITTITYDSSNATATINNNTSFSNVVIAAGAWSKNLVRQLGYKLPLEAERGYSYQLASSSTPELNRPVASAERKFIMTPMENGLRLAGTVEFAGLNARANWQRATMLYPHAQKLLKSLAPEPNSVTIESKWLGCRPSLPDSLPVIGRAPHHHNILFALGHQHLGLTQGAITGKLIMQLMNGEPTDIDISPFCISRFN